MKKLFCLTLLLALVLPIAVSQGQEQPPVPEKFKEKVQLLSGTPMLMAAKSLGMTEIMGKDITIVSSPPGNANAKKLKDVGIGIDPVAYENEPTVVANPKDKKKLVAGSHFFDFNTYINFCVAYYSSDGGATWSAPIIMPGLNPNSTYSDPVLAYAPDGSRVYFAYMDIKEIDSWPMTYTVDYDIVISYSDDHGATWTGPIVALDGLPSIYDFNLGYWIQLGFVYDKCWIGTHVPVGGKQGNSNWVYVTATQFDYAGANPDYIAFTRSADKGETWNTPPVLLDATVPGVMVAQGSRPTGGVGGDVLVAWYHSGSDGWLTGSFEIRTAYSSDNGATFNSPVTAVVDNYELPFWLGPYASYHRWWGGMFPDVEIDAGGNAHIIYTHDPEENVGGYSLTPEDGDIRYISSGSPPYGAGSWSAPVTLNDDGSISAQGYAALETQYGGKSAILHAIWEDHRVSAGDGNNLYFDMYYSKKFPGQGTGWFSNFRINEASSINDYIFIGDYNDLAANQTTLFGIWTDRRHQESIYAYDDNVFGSRIIAGGGLAKKPGVMGDEAEVAFPEDYALSQNYPNPFNPETFISFQLPETGHAVLRIFNVSGQEIRTLANGKYEAGYHSVRWDGRDWSGNSVSSGVYIYQLQAGSFIEVKKMSLLR